MTVLNRVESVRSVHMLNKYSDYMSAKSDRFNVIAYLYSEMYGAK